MRTVLTGKKYRQAKAYQCICSQCGQLFACSRKNVVSCRGCARRVYRRGRGKYRERCRLAGVPYLAGITPLKVFCRDGYRCQLCGRKTPERLRGSYKPNAPELDHIVPINAVGGSPGHVWTNVQCACRECNIKKAAHPMGQLRLA